MRCSHCQECCRETMMELSRADISRLERRGYRRDDFCYVGVDGIPRLKNAGVWCFFYDPERRRCREYQSRPLGCALYPVNIDEDGAFMIDALCPEGDTLTHQELKLKGKRLKALIATIDAEAKK
ncbi:YkgJ family cysteine cluster protein [Methanomassiliicoccus luminyensis]|uniref:YkgJ family cysteine cluster protein n=1 Tax=Methanomassiliicoccus luminyensis TaxID=1080712 RepID=UPI00035CF8B4|nr:YkgJ family cysteine cluster protein [Methanomassiliicoccus luminyensis]